MNSQSGLEHLRTRCACGDVEAIALVKAMAGRFRWYHNIEVVPGLKTEGCDWADNYVSQISEVVRTLDLTGKRVLDIGCRDGALSFVAEKLGASEVIGIDNDLSNGLTEFLIPLKRSKVQAFAKNLNELSRDAFGQFDVVIFAGLIYHLRYPMHALRRIADVLRPGGTLLIEGGFVDGFADLPVIFCPIGSDSPFEATSVTFFNHAGLRDTLLSIGFSELDMRRRFLPTFTDEQEIAYLMAKFPDFQKTGQRIWMCRKIYTCIKKWSDDHRIDRKLQELIMARYWDSEHAFHTKQEYA